MNCKEHCSPVGPRSRQTSRKKWNLLPPKSSLILSTNLPLYFICTFLLLCNSVIMIWLKISCEKWFSRLDLWREFSSNSYLTWSRVWSLDFAGFDENLSLSSFQFRPTLPNKRFQSNLLEINPPCNGCHRLLGYSHWSLCIGFSTGLSANSASPNEMMRRRIKIGKQ